MLFRCMLEISIAAAFIKTLLTSWKTVVWVGGNLTETLKPISKLKCRKYLGVSCWESQMVKVRGM